jgi:hypothetical protein
MPRLEPTDVNEGLLVFADVIESSSLSAHLGPLKYASELLRFQELFKNLGRKYFPTTIDRSLTYSQVTARGDEGLLFYVNNEVSKVDMIYRALEFIFELKGRLRVSSLQTKDSDLPPRMIELGAGIHYGPVALLCKIEEDDEGRTRSIIDRLEGYSINYAKRVETCSRQGSFSRVFLSNEAVSVLEGEPIIFSKVLAPLKGFGENVEVFEVRSGFFHDVPISVDLPEDESFINYINDLADHPDKIKEPWIKSLVISVLDSRFRSFQPKTQKQIYYSRLLRITWNSPNEDDPILLFIRAREYENRGDHTARITYLKKIIERFPEFIPARKKIVEAFWKVAQNKPERAERIFARDTADEFLKRFPDYLSETEREKFAEIVKELKK